LGGFGWNVAATVSDGLDAASVGAEHVAAAMVARVSEKMVFMVPFDSRRC